MKTPKISLAIALVSCLLYLGSLCLPCIDLAGVRANPVYGIFLLLIGWLGILDNVYAWYANPLLLLILCLLILKQYRWALLAGIPCLVLAYSTLLMREMTVNEAGGRQRIVGYGSGFYLWLASCTIPVLTAAILFRAKK
jgi:hypothetical protein